MADEPLSKAVFSAIVVAVSGIFLPQQRMRLFDRLGCAACCEQKQHGCCDCDSCFHCGCPLDVCRLARQFFLAEGKKTGSGYRNPMFAAGFALAINGCGSPGKDRRRLSRLRLEYTPIE